jgi:hypothetical protein
MEAKQKERDALAKAMEEFLSRWQGAGSRGQRGRRPAQEAGQQVRQPPYLSGALQKARRRCGLFVGVNFHTGKEDESAREPEVIRVSITP